MARIFSEFTEEKLEQIRNHPYYASLRESILEKAEFYLENDPPVIKFSKIHLYVTTGNREKFQSDYSDYESRMLNLFLAYLITDSDKYVEALADVIWNICDFESWSIPAHVNESLPIELRRQNLDLCSCVMGYRMAEILHFTEGRLPELVLKRARAEIRYRIIDSFAKYDERTFSWYAKIDNWASVCIAGILATYLYEATEEEIEAQLPRMRKIAENYLSGFKDDGCCTEGYGYWNYGFSFFCLFAKMLFDYTDGRINYFADGKVHKIAMFQQNILMNRSQCLSFSDGDLTFSPHPWLSHFLKGIYPDMQLPALPEECPTKYATRPIRYLVWCNPEIKNTALEPVSHIFEDAQWFLYHGNGYALGAKAGHNKEFHNHNDVGSFIISKGECATFSDPGCGEYTADYFSKNRYNLFITSSRAHSVPIINGEYQVEGKRDGEVMIAEKRRFKFRMDNGYIISTLTSLTRDFECLDDGVRMTDEYSFSETPTSVAERFVSLLPISTEEGRLLCGESVMHFDASLFDATVSSEQVPRKGGITDTVYYADLVVKVPSKEMKFTFEFK